MFLFLAFLAGLNHSPNWLIFWTVLALVDNHRAKLFLTIPIMLAATSQEADMATFSLVFIWIGGLLFPATPTQTSATESLSTPQAAQKDP